MFRPKAPFLDTLTRLGLTSGLKLCLDAGDAASYTSGQKWLDRSGNGYDFFLGTDGSAAGDDPTFTGTPGALTESEYFAFDAGTDFFTYDTTNETWMQNIHKDGATFTIVAYVYITSHGVGSSAGVTGTLGNNVGGNTGFQFQIDAASGGQPRFQVGNGVGSAANFTSGGTAVALNGWHLIAVSITENGGASGGLFWIDSAQSGASFNPAYTTPSSGNASHALNVGAVGNGAGGGTGRTLGHNGPARMAFCGIWEGVALTGAQITSIYNATDTLVANARNFALTGIATSFKTTVPAAAASYSLTGNAAVLTGKLTAVVGTLAETGQAALFSFNFAAAAVAYTLTGDAAVLKSKAIGIAGGYTVSAFAATFRDTLAAASQSYAIRGRHSPMLRLWPPTALRSH
jgi:hypothetical protein